MNPVQRDPRLTYTESGMPQLPDWNESAEPARNATVLDCFFRAMWCKYFRHDLGQSDTDPCTGYCSPNDAYPELQWDAVMKDPAASVDPAWVALGFGNPCKISLYSLIPLYKAVHTNQGRQGAFTFKLSEQELMPLRTVPHTPSKEITIRAVRTPASTPLKPLRIGRSHAGGHSKSFTDVSDLDTDNERNTGNERNPGNEFNASEQRNTAEQRDPSEQRNPSKQRDTAEERDTGEQHDNRCLAAPAASQCVSAGMAHPLTEEANGANVAIENATGSRQSLRKGTSSAKTASTQHTREVQPDDMPMGVQVRRGQRNRKPSTRALEAERPPAGGNTSRKRRAEENAMDVSSAKKRKHKGGAH